MAQLSSHEALARLTDQVYATFGGKLSAQAVETSVRDAGRDLRGSVSVDSLPEMAGRLAVVRLNSMLESFGQGSLPAAWTARLRVAAPAD
jgi:hypothetical protein